MEIDFIEGVHELGYVFIDESKVSAIDALSLETTMKKKDQILRRKTNKKTNFKRKHKKKNKKMT